MKEVAGYIVIAQAILTGIIAYTILRLGDSIKASAALIGTGEGGLSWGGSFPVFIWFLLIVVIGLGVLLVLRKK